MEYADANGYLFSAVTPLRIRAGEEGSPGVSIAGTPVNLRLRSSARLRCRVRNLESAEQKIRLSLLLPRELKCLQPEKEIVVSGKTEDTAAFRLSEVGALEGSSYAVVAVAEYEKDGLHRASASTASVRILAARSPYVFALLVLGVFVLVVLWVFRKK